MKDLIIGVILIFGTVMQLLSTIGVVRFKSFNIKLHCSGIASTFGIDLILIALLIKYFSWTLLIEVIILLFFLFITSPSTTHFFSEANTRDAEYFGRSRKDHNF